MNKMTYTFDKHQLHILNILIFDSSIEYDDLKKELKNESVEYPIERRTFENVTRKKNLLGTKTKYNGKSSILKFNGIKSIRILKENEGFKDNHFIKNIILKTDENVMELSTVFGIVIEFCVSDLFCVELIDLKDSEFGKGKSSGKHGFTAMEWDEFLKKEKYVLQHPNITNKISFNYFNMLQFLNSHSEYIHLKITPLQNQNTGQHKARP